MACACGKNNRNLQPRRGPTPMNMAPNNNVNLQPSSNKTVVPLAAERATALGLAAAKNDEYLSANRLRVEKLRREAIQKALGKQFL